MRRVTVREKDEVKQLKAVLLGNSSEIEVLQNLVEGFPSREVRLRGLGRGRFLRTEGRIDRLADNPTAGVCGALGSGEVPEQGCSDADSGGSCQRCNGRA